MKAGRKPLTGAQQNVAWDLARKHGLLLIEQGTNAFDAALFAFCSDLIGGGMDCETCKHASLKESQDPCAMCEPSPAVLSMWEPANER